MSSQGMQTSPPLDIPYAESVVARAGDGDRSVGKDFDTADGGGMAGERVDALSSFDIPYFDLLITTSRDYQTRFQPLPPSDATA